MRQPIVVVCLFVASSAMWCNGEGQRPSISGQWEGAVQIPVYELRVVIDLAQTDHKWIGSLTAPQFGVKGAPLTDVAIHESEVGFGLKGAATFKGRVETEGVLKGEYTQGGNTAPFLLKRLGEAHVELPEPSTPVSKEVQGEWKGAFQLLNSKINVILKLPGDGTPTAPAGELLVIDWGNAKIPVTLWKQDGNSIFALLGDSGMSYEGTFHKDSTEIAGTLRISFLELPLSLHPDTTATSAPARPAAHPDTK